MNEQLFKDYGGGVSSIQEAIEKFAVDLMMLMCGAPVKIVLDKHTYNRYMLELLKQSVGKDAPYTPEQHKQVEDSIRQRVTAAGTIEITCE